MLQDAWRQLKREARSIISGWSGRVQRVKCSFNDATRPVGIVAEKTEKLIACATSVDSARTSLIWSIQDRSCEPWQFETLHNAIDDFNSTLHELRGESDHQATAIALTMSPILLRATDIIMRTRPKDLSRFYDGAFMHDSDLLATSLADLSEDEVHSCQIARVDYDDLRRAAARLDGKAAVYSSHFRGHLESRTLE